MNDELALDLVLAVKRLEKHLGVLTEILVAKQAPVRRKYNNPTSREVAFLAKKVLTENGAPMRVQALYHRMQDHGLVLTSSSPVKLLGTMLWRERGIIERSSVGYWPVSLSEGR